MMKSWLVFILLALSPPAWSGWNPDTGVLSNEHLSLQIQNGAVVSLKNRAGKDLLFPARRTREASPIIVRLDGVDFTLQGESRLVSGDGNEEAVKLVYRLGNYSATVKYELAGEAVRVHVLVKNASTAPVDAHVRILLDTQVGTNDGSPFFIQSMGLIAKEREWRGMPFTDWFGYDRYPSPEIISHGHLETPPEKIIVAWWPGVKKGGFNYSPRGGDITRDSALVAYYPLGRIAPGGESVTISLAYGSGPPKASSLKKQLLQALKELRAAAEAKYEADLETMVLIDAAALEAITENKSFQQRFNGVAFDSVVDFGKAVVELGVEGSIDPSAGGLTMLLAPLAIASDTLYYGMDEIRTIEYLSSHFGKYQKIWVAWDNLSEEERMAKIRMGVAAGPGDELTQHFRGLDDLINVLESDELRLAEDYPYEAVLDVIARCKECLGLSSLKEVVCVSLSGTGDTFELHMIGTLGPHKRRLEAAAQIERAGQIFKDSGTVISWGGLAAGVGIKLGAAFFTGGTSVVVEGVVMTVGLSAFAASEAFKFSGTACDMTSDQMYFFQAMQAALSWDYERKRLYEIITQIPLGVRQAKVVTAEGAGVKISHFRVENGNPAGGESAVVNYFLTLENESSSPEYCSAAVYVPGLTETQAPLFFSVPLKRTLVSPGTKQISGTLTVPRGGAVSGEAVQMRAKCMVGSGIKDLLIASTAFKVGEERVPEWSREEIIAEGTIRQGEERGQVVEIQPDMGAAVFYLDYEGSDIDLHVTDPQGRHVGPDYRLGKIEAGIPGGTHIEGVGRKEIRLKNPAPGRYRVKWNAVSTHRRESYQVLFKQALEVREPLITCVPREIYLDPYDNLDLISISIMEISGVADAGRPRLRGVDESLWRVSGELAPGGIVKMEIRKPVELAKRGITEFIVECPGTTEVSRIKIKIPPEQFRSLSYPLALQINELRNARNKVFQQAGLGNDLWETTRFGRFCHPETQTILRENLSVRLPPQPAPPVRNKNAGLFPQDLGIALLILLGILGFGGLVVLIGGGVFVFWLVSDKKPNNENSIEETF
ncbi:MAG: hypothetical protein RRC34_05180 [Lentisphaeria bacterium]|nr:hypothetical protein [Lentisphaeria bacterium]